MCGIFAILLQNKECNIQVIKKSFDLLNKRGPDNSQFTMNGNYICGFKRLSINGLSDSGNQPFYSGKIVMMCNGEIYNHLELEKKYNLTCNSGSDCECIIKLYEKIGFEKMIRELDGDFAIIIIDDNKMYFARDIVGVRPLFMGTTSSGNIAVASIAESLLSFCLNVTEVLPDKIYNYNVDKLEVTNLNIVTSVCQPFCSSYTTHLKNTLFNSVKKRLMSDRPIGCMLSGGLDSSLITSIVCKLRDPKTVNTYSIGMEGSTDLYHARLVAKYLGTNHTEVIFTPKEGIDVIKCVIQDLETYDVTTIRASIPMWLLSKYISMKTEDRVILSGEGSDELLMGYLYFHYAPNSKEAENETIRLVKNLYMYDVCRADRCVSSHGLELRVPFLDKEMINLCLNIPGELRGTIDGIEKYLLRTSFNTDYLPEKVLWRRKAAFSDAVSGTEKKWYQNIEDFVNTCISDDEFDSEKYISKEAMYYKKIYDELFNGYDKKVDYWLPKWVNHNGNPSATIFNMKEID